MHKWIFTLFLFASSLGMMSTPVQAQVLRSFTLPELTGDMISLSDYASSKAVVLIFISANCPWVDRYEARIKSLYSRYHTKGVAFLAINSNDTTRSPRDAQVVLRQTAPFPFPYLFDGDQRVTREVGARKNPQVFVYQPRDGQFFRVYQGVIDDFPLDAGQAQRHYLQEALDAILHGRPAPIPMTPAQGCGIRWASQR